MRLLPDLVHVDGQLQSGIAVDVGDGRITALTPGADARGATRLPGALLLPGTVNTHCHTFQSLLHGATTCVDFFYLQDQGNDNAEAVIQEARDVGIRLVLARTMYDWEGAPARYR